MRGSTIAHEVASLSECARFVRHICAIYVRHRHRLPASSRRIRASIVREERAADRSTAGAVLRDKAGFGAANSTERRRAGGGLHRPVPRSRPSHSTGASIASANDQIASEALVCPSSLSRHRTLAACAGRRGAIAPASPAIGFTRCAFRCRSGCSCSPPPGPACPQPTLRPDGGRLNARAPAQSPPASADEEVRRAVMRLYAVRERTRYDPLGVRMGRADHGASAYSLPAGRTACPPLAFADRNAAGLGERAAAGAADDAATAPPSRARRT